MFSDAYVLINVLLIAVKVNENDSNDCVQFEFTKMLYILLASLIADVKINKITILKFSE